MSKKIDPIKEYELWENLRRVLEFLSEVLIIVAIVFMAKWIEPIMLEILNIQDGRMFFGFLILVFLLMGLILRETVGKLKYKERMRKEKHKAEQGI